jgi:hypothetical protein
VTYLQRSDVAEQHVPGSNAVPAHVVLALVAVGLAILCPGDRVSLRNARPRTRRTPRFWRSSNSFTLWPPLGGRPRALTTCGTDATGTIVSALFRARVAGYRSRHEPTQSSLRPEAVKAPCFDGVRFKHRR